MYQLIEGDPIPEPSVSNVSLPPKPLPSVWIGRSALAIAGPSGHVLTILLCHTSDDGGCAVRAQRYPVFSGETRPKYNDGHGFIRGRGEHPFAALYTWAVCRDVCHTLGSNWEEIITCLRLTKLNPLIF